MSKPTIPRGTAVLEDPALNKDTAFTLDERGALGLDGLLPPVVETLEQQSRRCYMAFGRRSRTTSNDHIYLRALQDPDETLFYRCCSITSSRCCPLFTHRWLPRRVRSFPTSTAAREGCSSPIRCATESASCWQTGHVPTST